MAASTSTQRKIAFALGGLAGANAHGMGFLQAARRLGIEPDIVSCTSGMIYWYWRWLEGGDLEAELSKAIAEAEPFPIPAVNFWYTMSQGLAGVFRPAAEEFWRRLFSLPLPQTMNAVFDRLLPAQMWVPTRPKANFDAIAECFNKCPTPIFFNSYSPRSGTEHLHMNPPAEVLYGHQQERRKKLRPNRHPEVAERLARHVPKVEPAKITAAAVADALWLTWYGFDGPDGRLEHDRRIDGAYARQFILSELSDADMLFMARPQSSRLLGPLPGNYFDVQDLQTELWFNGSYTQQLARIDLINRLIHTGALSREHYREIELVPIEIEVQRGYFAYFVESMDVFKRAETESTRIFQQQRFTTEAAATTGGNGKAMPKPPRAPRSPPPGPGDGPRPEGPG